jgi:large subunit ribosomal protein L24
MFLDPKENKPSRIGYKIVDGKKVRFSKKSGEIIN